MNLKNLKHSLSLKKLCIFNKISKMLPFVITLFYMSRRPKKVPFFGHKKKQKKMKKLKKKQNEINAIKKTIFLTSTGPNSKTTETTVLSFLPRGSPKMYLEIGYLLIGKNIREVEPI